MKTECDKMLLSNAPLPVPSNDGSPNMTLDSSQSSFATTVANIEQTSKDLISAESSDVFALLIVILCMR